jgi:hypothetical protein
MKPEAPRDRAWVEEAVRWFETVGPLEPGEVRAGLARWIPEYTGAAASQHPPERQAATAEAPPALTRPS